jgi:hypothetical protein
MKLCAVFTRSLVWGLGARGKKCRSPENFELKLLVVDRDLELWVVFQEQF